MTPKQPRSVVFAKQCEKCEHRFFCRIRRCENCNMWHDNKCYCEQEPNQTEREFCALYWPPEIYPEEREDYE